MMKNKKRTVFASCVLAVAVASCGLLAISCTTESAIILPNCEGQDCFAPGRALPVPFGAFVSVDRSLIVRGDVTAGFATVRATANSVSLFRWAVSPAGLLEFTVSDATPSNPLQTATGSTESFLSIARVIQDPGPTGTTVEVNVVVTELIACAACVDANGDAQTNANGDTVYCDDDGAALLAETNAEGAVIAPVACAGDSVVQALTMVVRRPKGPLTVSLSPERNTILPQTLLTLTASITGGDPFVTQSPDCSFATDCLVPPNNGTGYCVCWALSEDASLRSGSSTSGLVPQPLPDPEDSDEIVKATADYTAPLETGNVVFTVTVKDAAGNQSTSVVPVVVSSQLPLGLFAFSDNPAVAPSNSSTLTATASGGTPPYVICFEPPARGVLTPNVTPNCTSGVRPTTTGGDVNVTRLYTAPTIAGNDTIRVTVTDDVGDKLSDVVSLNISSAAGRACGDGAVQAPEQCDDGNLLPGDGCSPSCSFEGCGNGVVEPGEQCDDGLLNADTADKCRTNCMLATCGDNITDTGEGCDDGNNLSGDGCSSFCTVEECGNGIADPGEACDDGAANANAADACRLNCTTPRCSDGIRDSNEGCDDGNNLSGDGCSPSCVLETCGNGNINPGEECDNGANNSDTTPNACRVNCLLPRCGDGVTDLGEECDDGNSVSGDGCSPTCLQQLCGNGITDPGEQCDDGTGNSDVNPNACRTTCALPTCGDGVMDNGETCDDGNSINTDDCTNACENNVCGDGFRDTQGPAIEACDDGNDSNTDACLVTCEVASCGDGFVRTGVEVCDEGLAGNDGGEGECIAGCSAIQTCGDGTKNGTEVCDDGFADTCGSCNATCTAMGAGSTCGDGNLCPQNEACDDGDIDVCGTCNSLCTGPGIADTSTCDDGSACTASDTCQGGVCTGGTTTDCTGLTTECSGFVCNPDGAPDNCEVAVAINDGGTCNDGSACTSADTCQSGTCVGGTTVDCTVLATDCLSFMCDPGGAPDNCAVGVPINEGGICEDGLFCTLGDTCSTGVCSPGGASPCLVTQTCNEGTNACDP